MGTGASRRPCLGGIGHSGDADQLRVGLEVDEDPENKLLFDVGLGVYDQPTGDISARRVRRSVRS